MKSKKWGKRAEKIVAMTTTQLRAAMDKLDPKPTDVMSEKSAAAFMEVVDRGLTRDQALKKGLIPEGTLKKQWLASNAAENWLMTTAKGRGPHAAHARKIQQEIRFLEKQVEDWICFSLVFEHVRHIDLTSMMYLITGP